MVADCRRGPRRRRSRLLQALEGLRLIVMFALRPMRDYRLPLGRYQNLMNDIMITVLSYVGILSGFLVFTTVTYLGLLKIKLI